MKNLLIFTAGVVTGIVVLGSTLIIKINKKIKENNKIKDVCGAIVGAIDASVNKDRD